ncbi:hypothetical protein [Bradyrhizobium sp.]|uniref:hypothetical protein n=1 Tax=Bradyrhizobium sp. TaxID=376 RepID=UPI003C627972
MLAPDRRQWQADLAVVSIEHEEAWITKERNQSAAGKALGRAWGEKISAVEGIRLSPAAKQRAVEFDRLGLSPAERRNAIARAYRKG